MSDRKDRVGFIGLGRMGMPMALSLIEKGFALTGYDIDPAKNDALAAAGGAVADGPAAVTRAASRVIVMVETTAQAEEVITGSGGIGKRHMVIKYQELDRRYYLRDLGDGSGTFIRIDNYKDLVLKHGFIVSFGDSHMVV